MPSRTDGARPDEARPDVRVVDVESLADAAAGSGPAVVALGVPVISGDAGVQLAAGTPAQLSVAGQLVSLAVDRELCARRGFRAKTGEVLVTTSGSLSVVLLGCGDAGSVTPSVLRKAAAALVRNAGSPGVAVLFVPQTLVESSEDTPSPALRAGQALAEGVVLAGYRFVDHKTDEGSEPGVLDVVEVIAPGVDAGALADGVRRGRAVARAVCFARDLVNEPPSMMTPSLLAEAAERHLAASGAVTLETWDESRIAGEHLGGLLGVARGSNEAPRLLRASYEPPASVRSSSDGPVPHIVLVGKGITFDSGGLSLKTAEGMMTMKTDMSGAAAVIATVGACQELGVPVRVTAIAPITENMPGGRAIKPGDVLTVRDGQTIEVLNTDAEGRLVLSDGLSLASELRPDAIVDVATLTGACVVALGNSVGGLFSNDEDFGEEVRSAAERADEPLWPLPLVDDYRSHIESDVADMKNIGKAGQAGAISAALLLERFVGDVPWAHLDIAGPARSDEDKGILAKGGTGFSVRTLLELVEQFSG